MAYLPGMRYCNRCHRDRHGSDFFTEPDRSYKTCKDCRERRVPKGQPKPKLLVEKVLSNGPRQCAKCLVVLPPEAFINPLSGNVYLQCEACRYKKRIVNARGRAKVAATQVKAKTDPHPERKNFIDREEVLGRFDKSLYLLRLPFNRFNEMN